jgi:hypothetical protein
MGDATDFKLEKRAINSKSLCHDIQLGIEDLIENGGILWGNDIHRQGFIDTLHDFMNMFAFDNKIDQYDVICDLRNNQINDMDRGVYVCDISFRQKNCLNTSRLTYTITDKLVSSIKDLLDLQLMP